MQRNKLSDKIKSDFEKGQKLQEHKWIMQGMHQFLNRDLSIHNFINENQQSSIRSDLVQDFVSALRKDNNKLMREKAYKAIGQLFVQMESKYLISKDIENTEVDSYYLKFLETDKVKLASEVGILLSNLSTSKEVIPETPSDAVIGKGEFIGQDEYISTQPSSETHSSISVASVEYTVDDIDFKSPISKTTDLSSISPDLRSSEQDSEKDQMSMFSHYLETQKQNHDFINKSSFESGEIDYEKDPYFIDDKTKRKIIWKKMQSRFAKNDKLLQGTEDYDKYQKFKKDLYKVVPDILKLKKYPGSRKGLTPQEDTEFYQKWVAENKSERLYKFEEKYLHDEQKSPKMKMQNNQESSQSNEKHLIHDEVTYMLHVDEEYKLSDQENMPEWDLIKEQKYDTIEIRPMISDIGKSGGTEFDADHYFDVNEFDPEVSKHFRKPQSRLEEVLIDREEKQRPIPMIPMMPTNVSLDYHLLHTQMMDYDAFRQFVHMYNMMKSKYKYLINDMLFSAKKIYESKDPLPLPSLFAYYETLPDWARDHPTIKQLVVNLEYSKPLLSLKEKEHLVNFALRVFIPPNEDLEKVLLFAFNNSRKIRLNNERAREMMRELKPYDVDQEDVGTEYMFWYDSDEEEAEDEEYEDDSRLDDFKQTKQGIKTVNLEEEEKKKLESYEIAEDVDDKALKDFVIKPYSEPHQYECDPSSFYYPINYYDNEDGFWDDWIANKKRGYNENEMITKRPYVKH